MIDNSVFVCLFSYFFYFYLSNCQDRLFYCQFGFLNFQNVEHSAFSFSTYFPYKSTIAKILNKIIEQIFCTLYYRFHSNLY